MFSIHDKTLDMICGVAIWYKRISVIRQFNGNHRVSFCSPTIQIFIQLSIWRIQSASFKQYETIIFVYFLENTQRFEKRFAACSENKAICSWSAVFRSSVLGSAYIYIFFCLFCSFKLFFFFFQSNS